MNPQPPPRTRSYTKPWLSYKEQIALLTARGLTIADPEIAQAFLSHVNYYRFSGYCLAFEKNRHTFLAGTTFYDIKMAYEFDSRLRDIINEALEVIEIDIRTCLVHHLAQRHGAFGHINPNNFFERFEHDDWMEHVRDEVDRSSELFIEHFRETYAEYPDLPIWMLVEILSFGTLTRMYRGMKRFRSARSFQPLPASGPGFRYDSPPHGVRPEPVRPSLASLGPRVVSEGESAKGQALATASLAAQ